MAEKIYTKGLFINEKSSQYGNFFNIDIKAVDFINFIKENENEKGYCKISVYKAKEGGKNTHYAILNDWKPSENVATTAPNTAEESDDLPF
jgi:hypothetical protein